MPSLNNVTYSLTQYAFINLKQELSESAVKYAKITAIVAIILAAAAAVAYWCYRDYRTHNVDLAPTPTPTPALQQGQDPQKNPGKQNIKTLITPLTPKMKRPDPVQDDPSSDDDQNQLDADAALAAALQKEEEEEQAERLRKQQEYLKQVVKPTPTPIVTPTPAPVKGPIQYPSPPPPPVYVSPYVQPKPVLPTPASGPKQPVVTTPAQKQQKVPEAPFSKSVDDIMHEVSEKVFTTKGYSVKKAIQRIPYQYQLDIAMLLNELVDEFEMRHPQPYKIIEGQQVTQHFAQVKQGESDEQRKYWALCGIRNMRSAGASIVDDFAQLNFLGGYHHYGPHSGLNAFKYYTGNTVDLDTQLDRKNVKPGTKGEALNTDEALKKARELIVAFGKRCGLRSASGGELTAEEVQRQLPQRILELPYPGQIIHTATDHTDRSNHGIWARQSPTDLSLDYFVNVPNPDIVLSATLRFPYMVAELVWRAKAANGGKMSKEFLDDLFARGISDMCFNDKIKAFSAFHLDWMAKFDGVAETPEETARARILKGDFGDALKAIGPDRAIKEAFNNFKLSTFFDQFDFHVIVKGVTTPKDQWVELGMPVCINLLKKHHLWKAALYQAEKASGDHSDKENDYFLLDETTLKMFLSKSYYPYVLGNDEF